MDGFDLPTGCSRISLSLNLGHKFVVLLRPIRSDSNCFALIRPTKQFRQAAKPFSSVT
jgi:hypothetical protein